jgi:hypothetical protein
MIIYKLCKVVECHVLKKDSLLHYLDSNSSKWRENKQGLKDFQELIGKLV